MEQDDTKLLARDQVESLLENVSHIVSATTLFLPGQAEFHRHHLKPTICLRVLQKGRLIPGARVSGSSISAWSLLSKLPDTRLEGHY
jgi:hypothetical protein